MSFTNEELANTLENIAETLELQQESPYRIRAYRRAAHSLRNDKRNISNLVQKNEDLTTIPSIGTKIAKILKTIVLNKNLTVVFENEPIRLLPKACLQKPRKPRLFKISVLIPIIENMLTHLKAMPEIKQVECAGDYRRKKEIVGNIDILIQTEHPQIVFDKFYQLPGLKYIIKADKNTTVVQLKIGSYVTLHQVKKNSFASRLLALTGSKDHYKRLQKRAKHKKLYLIPNGLFNQKAKLSTPSETALYQELGLDFISPELRENRGEIEAALKGRIPQLVELNDIKGDLHCHTHETDGNASLEEMVQAAIAKKYQYVAITDHSQSLKITNGIDEKRLFKQIEQIDQFNATLSPFTILKSIEVDILEDGSLDLSNDVLKELDLTVCSIHSKFKLSYEKQTERILRAMDNPYFTILGHPTGRILQHRAPCAFDIERIMCHAKEQHCFLEVNAQPARLDMNDFYCKRAKEWGIKVAISTDAHTVKGFNFMLLGINQARRGWLEARDVLNTYGLNELKKLIKRI